MTSSLRPDLASILTSATETVSARPAASPAAVIRQTAKKVFVFILAWTIEHRGSLKVAQGRLWRGVGGGFKLIERILKFDYGQKVEQASRLLIWQSLLNCE